MACVSAIRLRPQTSGDRQVLLELFAEARAEEYASLGWSARQLESFLYAQFKAQSLDYARRFPGARFDVIEVEARPVGRFYVARLAERFVLIDISVARGWRGRGIATRLIRDLQAEAGACRQPICLHVHADNPARGLYERLGFTALDADGPALEMRWSPSPGDGAAPP